MSLISLGMHNGSKSAETDTESCPFFESNLRQISMNRKDRRSAGKSPWEKWVDL